MNWNFLLPFESNEALSLVDLFSSQRTAAFLSLEEKITKMDTVNRENCIRNKRWHGREEAMTERLKNWWERFQVFKGHSHCVWAWCLRKSTGLSIQLLGYTVILEPSTVFPSHISCEREGKSAEWNPFGISSYLGFNSPASVLGSSSEVHLFTFHSHLIFFFFGIWLSLNV